MAARAPTLLEVSVSVTPPGLVRVTDRAALIRENKLFFDC